MYAQYFGLKENPFALPPDPRYLYLSLRHQEALAHLMYGIKGGGGFVQLTGEVGTGKTMMIRALLERLPDTVDVALVFYPFLSVREFLSLILDDLRVASPPDATLKSLIDTLNAHLLESHAKGRRTVLIVDEAHKLNRDLLEQIRLLTNLETTKEKLLQIILVGQPEFATLLAQPDLRQLAQRITARYNLKALLPRETSEYVAHRLRVAGAKQELFTVAALRRVHRLSRGVPRLINVICDRALLGAYARSRNRIGMLMVNHAAGEVETFPHPRRHAWQVGAVATAAVATVAALAVAGWWVAPRVLERMAVHETRPAPEKTVAAEPVQAQPAAAVAPTDEADSAPVSAPAHADLAQFLADPMNVTDTDSAFTNLFLRWQLDYSQFAGVTGCERAEQAHLRCLFESGTWNNLRRLNRPAIIELVDAQGSRHHVVVAQLTSDTATLEVKGRSYEFPLKEVDRFWFGKYLVLWSPPDGGEQMLHRGMRGPAVLWVRDALARYGLPRGPHADSDEFDAALENQVKEFQRRNQLNDDGVVGRMTLVYLSTFDAAAAPLLVTARNESVVR